MPAIPHKTSARLLPEEIERIFTEHHGLVYRTAYRVTGNAEEAEDVLQMLFLRLLRRESPPDFRGDPRAYLHRSAVNIALDFLRVRGRNISADDVTAHIVDQRPTLRKILDGNGPPSDSKFSETLKWIKTQINEDFKGRAFLLDVWSTT